jgi:hypothetical protein
MTNDYLRQQKGRPDLEFGTEALKKYGIEFLSLNDGQRLVIESKSGTIDFWPANGRWRVRKTKVDGRGLIRLITYVNKQKE